MKIIIPTILAATILVAMSFALMPVVKVSTTHVSTAAAGTATDVTCAAPCISAAELAVTSPTVAQLGGIADVNVAAGAAILGSKIADAPSGITTAKINDAQVTSLKIADGTVGAADVAGSDAATGPVVFQDATGTVLTSTATTSFTPVVASQALVVCNAFGTNDATANTATTITLVATGNGVIQGTAAIKQADVVAAGNVNYSGSWIVTGITTASTFICNAAGTNLIDADTDRHSIFVLWFPQ